MRIDKEIIAENRKHLHSVETWISDEEYLRSSYQYGCPLFVHHLLNLPVNNELSYSDLIVHASRKLKKPPTYLEIGVSVGKNFYVMANALKDAVLYGFDWEPINPTMEKRFQPREVVGSLKRYSNASNEVNYVQGDVFKENDWQPLAGKKFNLIFSDAFHKGEALHAEYKMWQKLDLIDTSGFFLIWDDLDIHKQRSTTKAFWEIAEDIKKRFNVPSEGIFVTEVNGWLGQHQIKHAMGVVNTLGITLRDCEGAFPKLARKSWRIRAKIRKAIVRLSYKL